MVSDEESVNLSRWAERWREDRIGWHVNEVNAVLVAHGDSLLSESEENRVMVPLCGKTLDMVYFAKHRSVARVVGIDGIQKALDEFIKEQPDLGIQAGEPTECFATMHGDKISLLKGDFFQLSTTATGAKFHAVLDRGSLIAIEPTLREAYVKVMGDVVLAPGGKILLVTVENENTKREGPPFFMTESDVRQLYECQAWVASVQVLNPDNNVRDGGGSISRWYMIEAKKV